MFKSACSGRGAETRDQPRCFPGPQTSGRTFKSSICTGEQAKQLLRGFTVTLLPRDLECFSTPRVPPQLTWTKPVHLQRKASDLQHHISGVQEQRKPWIISFGAGCCSSSLHKAAGKCCSTDPYTSCCPTPIFCSFWCIFSAIPSLLQGTWQETQRESSAPASWTCSLFSWH